MNKNNKKQILAIETSCDETGVCLLSAEGEYPDTEIAIHANELASQIKDHQEYGGVFPSLAKRLHARNFPTLLKKIFTSADTTPIEDIPEVKQKQIKNWLSRHADFADQLLSIIKTVGLPELDSVAVTVGPGLEPALWVGINTARSIALILDIPLIPVNHMEGHLVSGLAPRDLTDGRPHRLAKIEFPAVALLVSGGHTELIHIDSWQSYKKIGQTRDDAAGEAFDKVGRLLGLPYPAGAHISELAEKVQRDKGEKIKDEKFQLPRPMIDSEDLDFSFSGLKTAAARRIEQDEPLTDKQKAEFARKLQTAIVDVLVQKTQQALKQTGSKTLLVGGGVSANQSLRERLKQIPDVSMHISPRELAGDNAVMIGLVASQRQTEGVDPTSDISADSRLSL